MGKKKILHPWGIVYILKCRDNSLYTGSTVNLKKRVHQHNALKSGARYTKSKRPVQLVYSETYPTLQQAKKREYEIKQLKRKDKLTLINSTGVQL